MTFAHFRLAALAALALATGLAQAQTPYTNILNGRQFNNMYAANADFMLSQMIQRGQWNSMNLALQQQIRQQQARQPGAAPAPAPAPAAPKATAAAYRFPITATDFRPAGPRNAPEMLASGAANPKDRQQLVEAGRSIHKAIEATPGFRRNNLAAAMTVLLGVSLQVTYGVEFDDAQSQAIVRQFNDVLGDLPAHKALDAAQRTQMYDAFIVIGGFIAGIAHEGAASGNAEMVSQAKSMARDALAQFGFRS